MTTLEIVVHGIPAPQGSKRHVGGGRMIESSKAVGPWREAVRAETQRQHDGDPLDGPLRVSMVFALPRPRGHYGAAGRLRPSAPAWPAVKPDVDKLVRSTLDGLVAGGAIADDARVVALNVAKAYSGAGVTPGVVIRVDVVA